MFEQINQWHLNFLWVKVVDQQFLKNYFAAATRKIDLKAKTKCTTRFSTLKTIYLDSLREKIKFSRLLFSQSFGHYVLDFESVNPNQDQPIPSKW